MSPYIYTSIYIYIYTYANRTPLQPSRPPLTDLPSIPKKFVAERDVYRVLLENGESFIFKPACDEEPANDRDAYVPQDELAVYNRFKYLQGRYIPICYGIVTLRGKVDLLMEDCGSKTFENPPLDENTKFILFLRAMCAMERCLSAGLVHQDAEFRNIIYNPVTLQVRIIDIEIYRTMKGTCHRMYGSPYSRM